MLARHIAERRLVDLIQPEEKATHVGLPAQVAEILRRYECPIVFRVDEGVVVYRVCRVVVGQSIDNCSSPAGGIERDESCPLACQVDSSIVLDVQKNRVNEARSVQSQRILRGKLGALYELVRQINLSLREACSADHTCPVS